MPVSFVVELTGYLLFILAAALQLIVTIVPEWSVSDVSKNIIEYQKNYNGLWWKCTGQNSGDFTCDDFDSYILGAKTVLIVTRACMILSIVLNLLTFLILQPALIWVQCLPNEFLRVKFMITGLFCMVCSFAAVLIGSGWYGRWILDDYILKVDNKAYEGGNNLFIFGNCLYVVWISLVFHFGGIVMFGIVITKGTTYDGKFDSGSSFGGYTRESFVSNGNATGNGVGNGKIVHMESGHGRRDRSVDKTQYI